MTLAFVVRGFVRFWHQTRTSGPRLRLVRLSPAIAATATAGLFAAKAPI